MKVELDISNQKFEQVGTSEARLFFEVTEKLANSISFQVWGMDLVYSLGQQKLEEVPGLNGNEDIHIAGMATITISEVIGGALDLALIDIDSKSLIYNQNRNSIHLYKNWPCIEEAQSMSYVFGGVLNWPQGSCELTIISTGRVTIKFDSNDCIPVSEYILHPEKYKMGS